MIKDLIVSFQQNFKEKTKNPFLGTYLIVWLIINWRLVFTIFNFDDDFTLSDKIDWIEEYYENRSFLWNLVTTIFWAFVVLITTYILLNISRLIINFSEKKVSPFIYKITDSNSIVLKETYDKLSLDKNQLEIKIEKERENKVKLQNEISRLEKVIEDLYNEKSNLIESEEGIENEKDDKNYIEENPFQNKTILSDFEKIQFDKIKAKGYLEPYITLALTMQGKDGWVAKQYLDERIDYFQKLGLINQIDTDTNHLKFEFSKEGFNILRQARLEVD